MAPALATVEKPVFYENSSTSLLALAPAIIPETDWKSDQDWNDMRSYLEQVLLGMRNWRTPWWMHWGELAANILPRRYHWLITPNNMTRGLPINQDVVDSTPAQAVGVCSAGMMDGLSSPSKIWFRLQPAIRGFEPDTAGLRWLKEFQSRIYDVLAGSNYYDSKHQMYEDEIVFGTGDMLIYEDREKVINCQNPCAGEYYHAVDGNNNIDTFYREFTMTVRQMMARFGPDALEGTDVSGLWNTKGGNLETEAIVAHSIEPNFAANMPGQKKNLGVVPGPYQYREYYWLRGKNSPKPLSVRGFQERPFMAARWNTRSNDPYGRSPGMDALPDVRQLNQMTRRFAEAIDKMVRPPMLADVTLKNEPSSILPGRVTYVSNLGKDSGMRPTYTVNPQVAEMAQLIEKIQQRVERWFFNDVFMAITQMEGVQPRNELEINMRQSERLMRLGPVIERNLREDAAALTRIVSIMVRRGLVPPKPPSLRGVPIQIKFTSKLALLQEAAVTGAMERTLAMAGRMEAILPGTLDEISASRFIRDYGDKIEFPADDWATDEEKGAESAGSPAAAESRDDATCGDERGSCRCAGGSNLVRDSGGWRHVGIRKQC